jgi:hypothetical protein
MAEYKGPLGSTISTRSQSASGACDKDQGTIAIAAKHDFEVKQALS